MYDMCGEISLMLAGFNLFFLDEGETGNKTVLID